MNVLMLVGRRNMFQNRWALAARSIAKVVTVRPTDKLTSPALSNLPFLGQETDKLLEFEMVSRSPHPRRLLQRYGTWRKASHLEALIRYLRDNGIRVDLIHGHFASACSALPRVSAAEEIPYVVTEHSSKLSGNPYRRTSRSGLRLAARVYANAAAVICVSRFLQDDLADKGLIADAEIIPNPVDVDFFYQIPGAPAMRDDTIRCLNVGRPHPIKGHDLLLEAFADASKKEPRLRLDIVGARNRQLLELRERLGLDEVVTFHRRETAEEIASRMATTDFFILSSRFETFGLPLAEALSCGLPVVASRVGAAPELITRNDGVLVSPSNSQDLARGIVHMAETYLDYDRAQIARRARAQVSTEAVASQLDALYARIVPAFGR